MTRREKAKAFALKHPLLIGLYRSSFGKLKTGLFFGMQRKKLQTDGKQLLESICGALNEADASYFIDCGTLLGMVRDGKLIDYDTDMDFGVYFNESFTLNDLDAIMSKLGLKRHRSFSFEGDVKEVSYKSGITGVDFFKHEEVDGCSYLYTFYRKIDHEYPSDKHFTTLIMHRAPIRGIKKADFDGLTLPIPTNAEEYLESAYSEAWRVPDPSWRYLMEPGLEEVKDSYGLLGK